MKRDYDKTATFYKTGNYLRLLRVTNASATQDAVCLDCICFSIDSSCCDPQSSIFGSGVLKISAREEWEKFFLHMNDQYQYEACIFIAYGHLQKSLGQGGDGSNHTLLQIL